MRNRITYKYNKNKGFTLVELIVVLVLITILSSLALFSGLAWQDWAKFNHEDTMAEEIFYAAQNQLADYDASGTLENRINAELLKTGTNGYHSGIVLDETLVQQIIYKKEGETTYKYDSSYIWSKTAGTGSVTSNSDADESKVAVEKTLLRLTAKAGDYDKYLAGTLINNSDKKTYGTKILFDIIASYVSDTGALNGAISLEFSPYTGQVFSVCYSDSADGFVYEADQTSSDGKKLVSILDRSIETRRKKLIGYFSVDELTLRNKGRSSSKSYLRLEIKNSEVLTMIVHDDAVAAKDNLRNTDTLEFVIYNGELNSEAMKFSFKLAGIASYESYKDGLASASANPTLVTAVLQSGKYNDGKTYSFRVPVWKSTDGKKIYIVMDAADVQAQTLAYDEFLTSTAHDSDAEVSFRNTYSFYRFGLSDTTRYIYADVSVLREDGTRTDSVESGRYVKTNSGNEEFRLHSDLVESDRNIYGESYPKGECIAFDSFLEDQGSGAYVAGIKNARHLYNMRYETEYKKTVTGEKKNVSNIFKLQNDISWSDFVDSKIDGETGANYFLNSYKNGIKSGINIDGLYYATRSIALSAPTDTKNYPFPGFRNLDSSDVFTQDYSYDDAKSSEDNKNYQISDLNISISANIVYGVYGREIKEKCTVGENNLENYDPVLGLSDTNESYSNSVKKPNEARAGKMPLGLFAENLGEISNITLNRHVVKGLEEIGSTDGSGDVVYTCMVGGFVGDNLGEIDKLTLLDTKKVTSTNEAGEETTSETKADVSCVSGRTDVGGIIGRESFVASADRITDKTITIENMKNYAVVTGKENVGGIVGRVYTHYVCGLTFDEVTEDYGINDFRLYTSNLSSSTLFTADNFTTFGKYRYYHDGYEITDSFKSISGESVGRVDKVEIKNCVNRGSVSGDELVYSGKVDPTSTNSAQCAFIGGIAGITQDGLVYDDKTFNNYKTLNSIPSYTSYLSGEGDYKHILVENCNSYVAYDIEDTDYLSDETENKSLKYDNYVGGLIGYARLTVIKNINTAPDEDMISDGVSKTFVFGRRYVGGLCGVSDFSRYDIGEGDTGNESNERVYAATNYNNVIGRMFVGGVAGGNGVGDISQENLNFRNPSENTMSAISQYKNDNKSTFRTFRNVLNTGVVLTFHSKSLYHASKASTELPTFNDNASIFDEFSGAAGGVVGINRTGFYNCDNFQSQSTKKYAMKLITGTDEKDLYSDIDVEELEKIVESSSFGGEYVGGLVGICYGNGYVNPNDNDKSEIDAIVFGQDCVGGAIGTGLDKEADSYTASNMYPVKNYSAANGSDIEGLAVVGKDCVGGLFGKWFPDFTNKEVIDSSYLVKGRYAVGGICGIRNKLGGDSTDKTLKCSIDIDNSKSRNVQVEGVAYAGGIIGVSESNTIKLASCSSPDGADDLSGIDIKADFFAGGLVGAVIKKNQGNISDSYIGHDFKTTSDVNVNAKAFAGGKVGLFATVNTSSYKTFCSLSSNALNSSNTGTLYKLAAEVLYDSSSQMYCDSITAYKNIANGENGDINSGSVFSEATNEDRKVTLDFNDFYNTESVTPKYSNLASVSAEISAGGLFGYVPEGMYIDIKDFVNNGNIKTTASIPASELTEMPNDEDIFCSYLGGVIGRVSSNMKLIRCKNIVSGSYKENAEMYYSSQATCLGGLTEVNTGTIIGHKTGTGEHSYSYCQNDTAYSYSYGGIAAFVGINGTLKNDDQNPASIEYCENIADISSTGSGADNEAFVAGIASISCGDSVIEFCDNKGTITAAHGNAAGILCEAREGNSVINFCNNGDSSIQNANHIKNITATNYAAGILSVDKGTYDSRITNCFNYDAINASGTNGEAAGIMCIDASTLHTSQMQGCVIEKCENHGSVDAKNAAAGIYCETESGAAAIEKYYLAIKDSVNTGVITNLNGHKSEKAAGIAYDTKEWGRIALCRNYGTGLKYGITAKDAYKIHYCFDATNSEEHIGNTYASAPATSKYANFYVGEKKPTYFKAEACYGIATVDKNNKSNVTQVKIDSSSEICRRVLGEVENYNNDSYDINDKGFKSFSSPLQMDFWGNTDLIFRITPTGNDSPSVDMDSISIYWDNYLARRLSNNILVRNYSFECNVEYRVIFSDSSGKYRSTELIAHKFRTLFEADTITTSGQKVSVGGKDYSTYTSEGFDKGDINSVEIVIESIDYKLFNGNREALWNVISNIIQLIPFNNFDQNNVYIRPFRWTGAVTTGEEAMLKHEDVGLYNVSSTINTSGPGLDVYCNDIVSSRVPESMFTMGPETSSPYQLLLNGYETGMKDITYNTYKDTNYLNDFASYTHQSNSRRLKMWQEIDQNYISFINSNFGNGLEGDFLENDEIIGDNIADESVITDDASASDATTGSNADNEDSLADDVDAKEPDEMTVPEDATPGDAEMK